MANHRGHRVILQAPQQQLNPNSSSPEGIATDVEDNDDDDDEEEALVVVAGIELLPLAPATVTATPPPA